MQFYDEVEREITALPGVRGVAWTNALPLDGTNGEDISFEIAGDPPRDERQRPTASYQVVSPITSGRSNCQSSRAARSRRKILPAAWRYVSSARHSCASTSTAAHRLACA